MHDTDSDLAKRQEAARRDFLKRFGKLAVITPPAISLLLSTSLDSPAVALSGVRETQ